jgi:thiol-disulfide isomerase/thioredoxin
MTDRATFLTGLLAAVASPSAKPAPAPAANPWDACDTSKALPYDKPLDLKMQTLDGPDFRLMNYRGKGVLLNIFATWCGPCNHEQPALVAAAEKYGPMGLSIIGINDREADDTVRAYRKKYGITFPIAMDRRGGFTIALQDGNTTEDLHTVFPVSIFINPYGYLYCYRVGSMSGDELDHRIATFLKESPPAPLSTAAPSASPALPTPRR